MSHDLPVPGHQRLSLAELPRPRRHRILAILRRHAPVVREPQPATRHLGLAAAGTFRPFQQAIRTARLMRPLPTAIQSVTSTGLRSSRARAPSGERGGVAGDDGRRGGGPGGTAARACSAWAGVCPARMRCGIRSATSIPGSSADRLRPVDQPDLLVLADEQIAGVDVALQQRVPVRRRQPAGFQPGQAGEVAAGPGVQAGRRISGQFAPAVDQPGQFAGRRRRGGDGAGGPGRRRARRAWPRHGRYRASPGPGRGGGRRCRRI